MTRVTGAFAALCALALLAAACNDGDGTVEQANSNTSWLMQCVADAECGADFACLCGVCTRQCAAGSCDDLGGTCAAVDSAAHALQCGGGDQVPVCLRPCTAEHAECGDAQTCTAGGCAARPTLDPCANASDALVCSSFEDGDAGTAQVVDTGGALELSGQESLFGATALSASVPADGHRSFSHYEFEAQDTGTLYLRAWLYLDMPDTSALHVHALTVGSVDDPDWGTSLHVLDGKLGLSFPQAGDVVGELPVPAQRWFCVRAQIDLDATAGAASAWLDDALSVEASGADTLPAASAHNIAAGIDYTDVPDVRLFVDGLRLGTTAVGCTD